MRKRLSLVFMAGLTMAVLGAPGATAAGSGGTDRPFKATMVGQAHWEFPGTSPSSCEEVTTMTDATGQTSHLGKIHATWSHCPDEWDNDADGVLTIVAANGDVLRGSYDYIPFSETNDIEIHFRGGTGRFARAVGHATATYDVVPVFIPDCDPTDPATFFCLDFSVSWDWQATLIGTISY